MLTYGLAASVSCMLLGSVLEEGKSPILINCRQRLLQQTARPTVVDSAKYDVAAIGMNNAHNSEITCLSYCTGVVYVLISGFEHRVCQKMSRRHYYEYDYDCCCCCYYYCRSQWPRGLRRRSAAARLLRSWVRIPPVAWMFVCCECCVQRADHSSRGVLPTVVRRCV